MVEDEIRHCYIQGWLTWMNSSNEISDDMSVSITQRIVDISLGEICSYKATIICLASSLCIECGIECARVKTKVLDDVLLCLPVYVATLVAIEKVEDVLRC